MTHPDEYYDLAGDYELLEQENQRLRERIAELEAEIKRLTDGIREIAT